MGVRTFIAVDVNDEIRSSLQKWQSQLRNTYDKFRWVAPENFHITLSFLGNVDEHRTAKIANTLQETLDEMPPFELGIFSAGAFPHKKYPRVLWAGVGEGEEKLYNLQKSVASVLHHEHGFEPDERDYHPHITLARGKRKVRLPNMAQELTEVQDRLWGRHFVDAIVVMKSDLQPDGPVYTDLKRLSLAPETV